MEQVIDQLPPESRVLVIRLRSLGDCVLTTPAIALLKGERPDLRLGVVVEKRFGAIFEGNPDIDELLAPEVMAVARWRSRLAINFHGGTRSLALLTSSGAKFRAGFGHFRGGAFYNVKIPTAQEILEVERTVHTAEHLASAMFYLGVRRQEIPRARLYARKATMGQPYAVIHPLASEPEKTWPADNFLAVAERMQAEWGMEPLFIGAAGDDLTPFVKHRVLLGVSLEKIKELMAGASLFVGNDSGPAHMAAAFGVPIAVVFGPSVPEIWAPWKAEAAVFHAPDGIGRVKPDEVLAALDRLRTAAVSPAAKGEGGAP